MESALVTKVIRWLQDSAYMYHKFSIKGATPNKGAPLIWPQGYWVSGRFLAISQPKIVRFSFCKKPLEGGNALSLINESAP